MPAGCGQIGQAWVAFPLVGQAKVRAEFLKALEELDASVGAALPARLREMVRLRVSHLNGCSYSIKIHSEALAAQGVRVDLISSLARPVRLMRAGLATEAELAALRFAEVLSDAPRGLEAETRDGLASLLTGEQVGALVEVVALTHAFNRVTRGVD